MIDTRLKELRGEWERGVRQLEALDRQRTDLRETLLRIEGAIQVLEELVQAETQRPALARTS